MRTFLVALGLGVGGAGVGLALGSVVGHFLLGIPQPIALGGGATLGAVYLAVKGSLALHRHRRARLLHERLERDYVEGLSAWAESRGFTGPAPVHPGELMEMLGPGWSGRHRMSRQVGDMTIDLIDATLREEVRDSEGGTRTDTSSFVVVCFSGAAAHLPAFQLRPRPPWLGRLLDRLGLGMGVRFAAGNDDLVRDFNLLYCLWPAEPGQAAEVRAAFTRDRLHHFARHSGWHVVSRRGRLIVYREQAECVAADRDDFLVRAGAIFELFNPAEGSRPGGEVVAGEDRLDLMQVGWAGFVLWIWFVAGFSVGGALQVPLLSLLSRLGLPPGSPLMLLLFFGLPILSGVITVRLVLRWRRVRRG